jgi:hypothetical protein
LGFTIRNGKPYYTVDKAAIPYVDTELMKLPNGKEIERKVQREYIPEPEVKTPEEVGWCKKAKFEDIVLIPVANPEKHGKLEKRLFYRAYEVDVNKYIQYHSCNICAQNNLGAKFHFFRTMPSGVYHICWLNATKYGRSATGPIQTLIDREGNTATYVKQIAEKQISKREARQILHRLKRTPNVDVAMHLGGFDVV